MTDTAIANPAHDFIAKTVAENPVVLFMKDVLQDDSLRDGIKTFSDWPTIPQLYVKGEFIGGADIVREMFQSGELKTHLSDQGLLSA